jgi:hypothetical protein
LRTLLLIALLAAASSGWAAQRMAAPSIEQLAQAADIVAIGEVVTATGEWTAGRATIQTRVVLTAVELLKGTAPSPLTFTHLGGRVGDEASAIGGGPEFPPGERVLVFLSRRPDGSLRLADLTYARFEIVRDAPTGRDHATRAGGAAGADQVDLDHVRRLVRRALGRTD